MLKIPKENINIEIKNEVSNRFLPISESVKKNLESEPKFSDFEIIRIKQYRSNRHIFLRKKGE